MYVSIYVYTYAHFCVHWGADGANIFHLASEFEFPTHVGQKSVCEVKWKTKKKSSKYYSWKTLN